MGNYDDIKLLIKHTTGQENILGVNKVYMKYMGSLEGGVLLSQLIYYSDKSSRNDGYFWKSYKEWYEETFISEHNIKKIVSKMKELGFLETKLIKANAAPTIHYRVDMDKFTELFIPFLKILRIDSENIKNGNLKYSDSITKSTTENTNKDKDIKDIVSPKVDTIPYELIVEHLNLKTGKNFKHQTPATRKLIKARWNEGNELEEFKKVIDTMVHNWKDDLKMKGYLQPSTLFSTKFENYLNQEKKQTFTNQQQNKAWEDDIYGNSTNSYDNGYNQQQLSKPNEQNRQQIILQQP